MSLIIFIAFSCSKDYPWNGYYPTNKDGHSFHTIKIAVVSDIHYTDPSLLKNKAAQGAAFQAYVAADPKLLEYSAAIFRNVMSQLKSEKPDILLIPGDLTKDGEKVGHQAMAMLLNQLTGMHIQVFVVPGNHDVNNPEAKTYDGDNAYPTPSVSASEFSSIYLAYGYRNAISRDANSLSYVCQPFPGLWIFGIDDCEYYNNVEKATTPGKIKPETMQWALSWMAKARAQHIMAFAFMHHGMLEHYSGQNQIDPGYVTDNYETVSAEFMNAGLNIWFTGHYHANDITQRVIGNQVLYDIETGSPVMPPSPYRIVTLNNKSLDITTNYITTISASLPGGQSFPAYSNAWMSNQFDNYFSYVLSNPPYSLPDPLPSIGAPLFRKAFMAHFAGDERITPDEQAKDDAFAQIVPPLGFVLNSVWTDLPPADNQLHIKLATP